jgi:hypothetical protein
VIHGAEELHLSRTKRLSRWRNARSISHLVPAGCAAPPRPVFPAGEDPDRICPLESACPCCHARQQHHSREADGKARLRMRSTKHFTTIVRTGDACCSPSLNVVHKGEQFPKTLRPSHLAHKVGSCTRHAAVQEQFGLRTFTRMQKRCSGWKQLTFAEGTWRGGVANHQIFRSDP